MSDINKPKTSIHIKHPVLSSVLLALFISLIDMFFYTILVGMEFNSLSEFAAELFTMLLIFVPIMAGFVVYPFLLTLIQLILLITSHKQTHISYKKYRIFDLITLILGIIYTYLLLSFLDVAIYADWQTTLTNAQKHTPIYSDAALTIIVIALIGFLGYFIVNFIPLTKTPPLLMVLGISGMYLGTVLSIVFGIQTAAKHHSRFFFLLLPINCLLITIRTIIYKAKEWNTTPHETIKISKSPILNTCNQLLNQSANWPLLAFLLMWPLLGILIAILILFGQAPDAIVRAWTETSDWNLSQKVSPQNIYHDGHYLCTVAAGGHEKIVKPLRLGIRHGHPVIVNRQLCIANAFEQILEEKTPRFHKAVRGFYDKYGFPVAKLIRSKYIADIIYILMKPLEWFFLMVLYLVDVNPENRISIQYTGKNVICK